jgi:hypothetical protein
LGYKVLIKSVEGKIVFEEDITTTHVPEEKKSCGKIKSEDVDFID